MTFSFVVTITSESIKMTKEMSKSRHSIIRSMTIYQNFTCDCERDDSSHSYDDMKRELISLGYGEASLPILHSISNYLPQSKPNPSTDNSNIKKDCLQCRIIGATAFGGMSVYMTSLAMQTPRSMRSRRLFFGTWAFAAGGIALHRLFF